MCQLLVMWRQQSGGQLNPRAVGRRRRHFEKTTSPSTPSVDEGAGGT